MRAAFVEGFADPLGIGEAPDPVCPEDGVVLRVLACGVCRSDWHGWVGEHPRVTRGSILGHEYCGEVVAAGPRARYAVGDRLIEERVRVNARMHLFSLKQNLDLLLRRYAEKAIAEASADDWAKMRSHDGLDAAEATLQTLETMLKKRHQSIVIDMWVGSTTSA